MRVRPIVCLECCAASSRSGCCLFAWLRQDQSRDRDSIASRISGISVFEGFHPLPCPCPCSSFSFLPPCIFVAFNFSLIVKIFILICAFCTFCLCPLSSLSLSLSLSLPLSHLANLTTGVGWRYKRVALVWLDCPNNSYIKVIRGY